MKSAMQTKSKSCPNIISQGDKVKAKAEGLTGWSGAFFASDKQKAMGFRQ